MSKYNRFEDFMQSVINEADRKCRSRRGVSLADAYKVGYQTKDLTLAIIEKGWWVLVALCVLLGMGSIAFGVSLAAFLLTPAGVIIGAILVAAGGLSARYLYKNRKLPLAVKSTGELYKDEFSRHMNETYYIDSMINRASDTLLDKAIN